MCPDFVGILPSLRELLKIVPELRNVGLTHNDDAGIDHLAFRNLGAVAFRQLAKQPHGLITKFERLLNDGRFD